MTAFETVARIRVGRGAPVERLVCHPRLPLIAGVDSERPAVHVWNYHTGRGLETVGADSAAYDYSVERTGRARDSTRHPDLAWHPDIPVLVVATPAGVVQWAPADQPIVGGIPPGAAYHTVMFSPDGRGLWADPPSGDIEDPWNRSDVVDVASGMLTPSHHWLLRFAVHPGGGLAAINGGTFLVFSRVDEHTTPATMLRWLRKAGCPAYRHSDTTPTFSPDGRYVAVRDKGLSLAVFEFPSLKPALRAVLGEPDRGCYPYPKQYRDRMLAYPQHNTAFGSQPGVLWVGTPRGTLVQLDLTTTPWSNTTCRTAHPSPL